MKLAACPRLGGIVDTGEDQAGLEAGGGQAIFDG